MAGVNKPEFPPLLTVGFHEMTVDEVHRLCVDKFTASTSRSEIMVGLKKVIERLAKAGVEGHLWVNGSFMTEKIDPEDVDVLLCVNMEFYDSCSGNTRKAIDWLNANLKDELLCDSYLLCMRPMGHANFPETEFMHAYWTRQFGFDRSDNLKGIGVISLGEAA